MLLLGLLSQCSLGADVDRSLQFDFDNELNGNFLTNLPTPSSPSPPSIIIFPTNGFATGSPTLYPQNTCFFSEEADSSCKDSIVSSDSRVDRTLDVNSFICSPNKQYRFGITDDRFICLCDGIRKTWCADLDRRMQRDAYLRLKKDGCLSGYNDRVVGRKAIWKTIEGEDGSILPAFQNDKEEIITKLQIFNDGSLSLVDVTDISFPLWEPDLDAYKPYVPPTSTPTISHSPTGAPTISSAPTTSHAPTTVERTYLPGHLYKHAALNLHISRGLNIRLIGRTGSRVRYNNGLFSTNRVHDQPDAGGCFDQPDGGWIYVSNSEVDKKGGGVGAFEFKANGDLVDYRMIQTGSTMNCGGGESPWGTWFSGEETPMGGVWEVDLRGGGARMTQFGIGKFESATCDDRNLRTLECFASLDDEKESIRRYQPNPQVLQDAVSIGDYSNVMHAEGGTLTYLFLNAILGTFTWTTDKNRANNNAKALFPNVEGIDHHDGKLYFVSKKTKELFTLDLDGKTFERSSTVSGAFNHQPDQIRHIIGDDPNETAYLYFLEDGGKMPGVFARNLKNDRTYTIMEKVEDKFDGDESTGLAFCDNSKRLIVALQERGTIYEITREDGQPFYGAAANVKYHEMSSPRSGSTSLRASMD